MSNKLFTTFCKKLLPNVYKKLLLLIAGFLMLFCSSKFLFFSKGQKHRLRNIMLTNQWFLLDNCRNQNQLLEQHDQCNKHHRNRQFHCSRFCRQSRNFQSKPHCNYIQQSVQNRNCFPAHCIFKLKKLLFSRTN